MQFELWSFWHFLYMVSPFAIFAAIYFLVRNRSEKMKNIIGIIIGLISVFILIIRNVDIFIRNGWDLEIIPLQVCHIGSVIAGLATIFRKRWLILTSFCFNMIPAFLAMVFADSLTNYDNLLKIRPQTYVWGHIFIIVCALYGIFVFLPRLTKKDLVVSISFVSAASVLAIICNSAFRLIPGSEPDTFWEPNYFYLYNSDGTPLGFLYNATPTSHFGWFAINWLYTITLFLVFILVFIGLFFLAKLLVKVTYKK